jgi:photosystem II stability/assembly factor-like uncharacterized protein
MFVSTDGGIQWFSPTAGLGGCLAIKLAVDPRNTDVVYTGARPGQAAYCGSAYKSRDGGLTWARIFDQGFDVTSILVDPNAPDTVYVETAIFDPRGARSAVFRSTDGGESWTQLGSNLPTAVELVLEPSGQVLHAATVEGVFDYEIGRQPVVPIRTRDTRTLPWRP